MLPPCWWIVKREEQKHKANVLWLTYFITGQTNDENVKCKFNKDIYNNNLATANSNISASLDLHTRSNICKQENLLY